MPGATGSYGGVQGLLSDPNNFLFGLGRSPLFNVGVGLLDPSQSLSQAVLGGIGKAQQATYTAQDRDRIEKLRKELADLIKKQQQAAAGNMAAGGSPALTGGPYGDALSNMTRGGQSSWRLGSPIPSPFATGAPSGAQSSFVPPQMGGGVGAPDNVWNMLGWSGVLY